MKTKRICTQCGSEKYYCKGLCKSCHKKQLSPSRWSKKWDVCKNCGSSEFPHQAKGLCSRCYNTQPSEILCACGCGKTVTKRGKQHNTYLKGHWMKNNEQFMNAHIKAFTGENNPMYGKFGKEHPAYGHKTSKEVRELRRKTRIKMLSKRTTKPTDIEIILSNLLKELGINHISQHEMYDKFVVDEYLPDTKIVIEALGSFWHGDPRKFQNLSELQIKNQKRDNSKAAYLVTCGHRVLFLWGKDLKERPDWCKEQIKLSIKYFSIPLIQNPI